MHYNLQGRVEVHATYSPPPPPAKQRRSKKIAIAVASIAIIATAFLVAFALPGVLRQSQITHNQQQNNNPPQQQQTQYYYYPRLSAQLGEMSHYWARSTEIDLPMYVSTVWCSVQNSGNGSADNVVLTVNVDGAFYDQKTITQLLPQSYYEYTYSLNVAYDTSETISVQASCSGSSDFRSLLLSANLPRWPNSEDLYKLFITPNEASTVQLKNQILSGKSFLIPDWIALRDWVGNSITYKYDPNHGQTDYWQLPKETIQLRTGDCEDYAVLLCSLLRASGWSPNDVYVVLGVPKDNLTSNMSHAWVKINLGILGWYNLEPQQDGWSTFIGDFFSLSGYQAYCEFNDAQFQRF